MNANKKSTPHKDLHLAFDVGHSSIGWAVLRQSPTATAPSPEILGTGAVIFGADDCLAIKRRSYRQQRRHARATRQRIARIEALLAHLGVMSATDLKVRHDQGKGDSFSWQKAAEILAATRDGKPLPTIGWPDLWEILRWYAHNRGYFAPPWANRGDEAAQVDVDEVPDTEKVEHAHDTMKQFGTTTMAETIAAYTKWYEEQTALWQQKKRDTKPAHFKGLNAAFPRETVVWPEVHALLTALRSKLPKLDDALIRTLLGDQPDPMRDREAWKTVACPSLTLPKRYMGGLLFGQMIPRFDNRIIGVCPIHFARRHAELLEAGFSPEDANHEAAKQSKLPAKATPEFLLFRWAMQLANVFGAGKADRTTRPLTADERQKITEQAEASGSMGKKEFEKAIHALTGWDRSNIANMLMHPDAEKALVLDPVQREIANSKLSKALTALPSQFAKRLKGKLANGKNVTLAEVRSWLDGQAATAFDAEVERLLDAANTRKGKKQSSTTRHELLDEKLTAVFQSGRAPYARPILRQAIEEVMKGWDPRAEKSTTQPRGCLCQTNELKEAQLQRNLAEQTNNHLIRHRLLILERLQKDLIAAPEFASGDATRIASVTIEVARDLRDLSGKTRKEQEQDLGIRLKDFKGVAVKVEEACKRRGMPVTAGLIRKARVAEDLDWTCPYTGKVFEFDDLLNGAMDKEHIIPHADRQSDSLDSLVVTWKEVNKWKGKRTAMEFIRDEGGKPVPGKPQLSILPLAEYLKHVNALDVRKGHQDDKNRKKRRQRRLLTEHYEEKEFTPRDLTVTSHLVRLGAQVLQRQFKPGERPPVISLPGSVTGEVRKAWKLIGCLGAANPAIFEADGKTPKRKQEIRGITHLHHALDACVLGLSALYFPRNGAVWGAMVKAGHDAAASDERRLWLAMTRRRPTDTEAALLRATGLYQRDSEGRMRLADLPEELKEQVRKRLAEKRVVQHVPADMSGIKVEENTRGICQVREDGRVELTQKAPRDPKTGVRPESKATEEATGKLLGLAPTNGGGKLQRQKGVRVITDNFGVAILDHAPEDEEKFVVIPWHRVWHRLAELKERNGGQSPRVIRNGQTIRVPSGNFKGSWRVFSAKNNATGVALDIGYPDVVRLQNKTEGHKINVRLTSLLAAGLECIDCPLIGLPSEAAED